MFVELSSNFSCPSQKKLLLPTRGRKQVRSQRLTFILRTSAQRFLGKRFPSSLPRYSPSVALKEQARHVIPFIPPPGKPVDNGQECRPTTKTLLSLPSIERADRY